MTPTPAIPLFCKLGLHSWRPVHTGDAEPFGHTFIDVLVDECRRCPSVRRLQLSPRCEMLHYSSMSAYREAQVSLFNDEARS